MKIYHTETQADYDALMVELESDGVTWRFGALPTKENNWKARTKNMCVAVSHQVAEYGSIDTYLKIYPDIPITKYKAKADEKMKFTKENVEKVIDEYFWQADFEPCGDLIAEIRNLDDTPEKVVVPKFVAEWIELCKEKANLVDCLQGGYRHFNGCEHIGEDEDWLFEGDNQDVVARAWLDGYEVEKVPLYHVMNKHECFLLRRYGNEVDAMRISHTMKKEEHGHKDDFKLTESEIKDYDERFWPFAVLADD